MPIGEYNVGRDVSLDIVGPAGPIRLTKITRFHSKQETTDQRVKRMDGITDHLRYYDGWTGGFDLERADSTVDDLFAQLEANYYAGLTEQPVTITETIQEVNGATTQYRYLRVLLKLDDAGEKKGDATIGQKLSFVASRRVKMA